MLAGGLTGTDVPSYTEQPATQVQLNDPSDVATDDSGNVYIADTVNNEIEEVISGQLQVIAGGGGAPATTTPQAADAVSLEAPDAVAVAANGDIYIADTGDALVLRLTPDGQISVAAGGGGTLPSTTSAAATGMELNTPTGLAFDSSGNLYITDQGQDVVDELNASTQELSVIAGEEGSSGAPAAGPATGETLDQPTGVTVDSAGNVFIADSGDSGIDGQLLEVGATGHDLTIVAGTGTGFGLPADGDPLSASLPSPVGLAIDNSGNLYFADEDADDVLEISGR